MVSGPQVNVPELIEQLALLSVQVTPAGRVSVMTTPVASPSPLFARLMVYEAVSPAVITGVEVVFVRARPGSGVIALLMIWLSRFPIEAPSTAVMRMWYGPPLMLAAPRFAPHPRGPKPAARCPPKRSCTWPSDRVALKLTVTDAKSSPVAAGAVSCVIAEAAVMVPPYITNWRAAWGSSCALVGCGPPGGTEVESL